PGTQAGGRSIRGSSHWGTLPIRIAGRHLEFRYRVGGISASDDSPAHHGEAMAPRSCCLIGCVAAGLLAWRWTDLRTALLRTITRGDGGKACLHAKRHLADLSGPPLRGHGTRHAANRLSAI